MKTKFKFTILTVALAAILFSCHKDKEEPANYFSFDGSKKDLKSGLFFYDDTPNENQDGLMVYSHEIALLGGGLEWDNTIAKFKGTGNVVDFSVITSSENLDAGTYTYTGTDENIKPFDCWDSIIITNYTASNSGSGESYVFDVGTIKVAKDGEVYTIDFDGTIYPALVYNGATYGPDKSKNSIAFKGHYKGPLLRTQY